MTLSAAVRGLCWHCSTDKVNGMTNKQLLILLHAPLLLVWLQHFSTHAGKSNHKYYKTSGVNWDDINNYWLITIIQWGV
jgi:hypothetical protein